MTYDHSEWEKDRQWCKKKAKEVCNLSPQDFAFIDNRISEHLKEKLRHWAAHEWWSLFGSQGHDLSTPEHESKFIETLDKIFVYPAPSSFLNPPSHNRQKYVVTGIAKRGGARQKIEFNAPPVGRLLELMLYGFFNFEGRWVFLSRLDQLPNETKKPQRWHVLEEGIQPTDRLGVRITVKTGWKGRHHPPPNAAFSSLPNASKEYAATDHGSPGTHQEWMEGLADDLCKGSPYSEPTISLELAGEYPMESYPLADLIANGKRVSGMRVEPINGDHFDCRPENLISRSSRGRKMLCNSCHKQTTAKDSGRVKDSTGSTFRICRACQAWAARR
ncbi:hypothetical protein H7698_13840 [Pseudomonas sp. p50]|uniref:hypothetical protein n=1 Tax=Pseudomonas sp. p50(2008) TaxID=2816832 RepID=UPI00188CEEB5|nr:hypothetical protein [Pseudomonas sp. p50(2008)]MBF4557161.1 hypothetical protein [Pseudomonas sp. p50(2008)]